MLYELDELGERFMAEVRSSINFFSEKPIIAIPEAIPGKKGKKAHKLQANIKPQNMRDYVGTLQGSDWQELTIRDGTKKKITSLYLRKKVWIWEPTNQRTKPLRCYLLIRKSLDGKEIRYSLTNASEDKPLKDLAYAQGQRFFVEQSFKESKNQVGMGDYQVRGWDGFHHHIACSMMSLNFIMEQKYLLKEKLPYITAEDIRKFITICFPALYISAEEQIRQLIKKHDTYGNQIKRNLKKKEAIPIR